MYPDITSSTAYQNEQRTGYADGGTSRMFACPVCGEIPFHDSQLYRSRISGEVTGCDSCMRLQTVEEYLEEIA